jgi:hypothetical protein
MRLCKTTVGEETPEARAELGSGRFFDQEFEIMHDG